MIRTQIQLSAQQAAALKQMASSQSLSVAALIRRAIDRMISTGKQPDKEEIRHRAAAAAGRFKSGVSDLAERHDDYLADALEDRP